MSRSRSQKLIEAAMLIKNNCQGLKSRDKCKKCVFNSDGESTICLLDPPGEFEPDYWIIPKDKVKTFATKADVIRAMSNDELAKLLHSKCGCAFCVRDIHECKGDVPCIEGIRAWLGQEVGCDE